MKLGRTKLIVRKWSSSSQYQSGLAINEQRLLSFCGISTSLMGGRVRFINHREASESASMVPERRNRAYTLANIM
jgi:hypothetical protein